jgi:hypothetical protein
MPRQHFPRDLGVPRFVGAKKSERRQTPKKEEGTERQKQDPVGDAEAGSSCQLLVVSGQFSHSYADRNGNVHTELRH